ncbi:MAG TPA: hypothetical protein VFD57_05325 [Clostridia bacterium]|nr:hypothetical protein [Clostridia bacterium]
MSSKDDNLMINNQNQGKSSGVAYLLALPAVFLLFIYKIVPALTGLTLPFREYSPMKGMGGSTWVGMRNFKELFSSFVFSKILGNTLILKIQYILLCSILAFLLLLVLGFIKSKFWQRLFSSIFLLPYFIPTVVFSYLMLYAMGNAGMYFIFSTETLMDPESFRLIYISLEIIKTIGIPLIMGLGAISAKRDLDDGTGSFLHIQLLPILKALGLFALIQLSAVLTMDYELLTSFQNPLVYEVADTIDTHAFRTGLMNMNFGTAGAVNMIKYFLQIVLSILIYFLIKKYFVEDNFPVKVKREKGSKRRYSPLAVVAGLFIVEIYLILTTAPLLVSVVETFKSSSGVTSTFNDILQGLPFYDSFMAYLTAIAFAVVVNSIITLLLAYPLTVKELPGKSIYAVFLILVLNLGMGSIHEYLFFTKMNMINTIWPYVITGFFTLVNVFVLKAIFNGRYNSQEERTVKGIEGDAESFFKRFIPRIWKPLLGLSALQYAFMWNSIYPGQLMYLNDASRFSPVMMFRMITQGNQGQELNPALILGIIKLGAIVSIPGIIILLLLMIFGGHEVFIGQNRRL